MIFEFSKHIRWMGGSVTPTMWSGQYPHVVLSVVGSIYYDYDYAYNYQICYLLAMCIQHEHVLC